jgi:hypothetical protein
VNAETVASLVIAGLAVVSAIGSVAVLSFRVGSLVGIVTAHIATSDSDRARIWQAVGEQGGWLQRHLEIYHGKHHDYP